MKQPLAGARRAEIQNGNQLTRGNPIQRSRGAAYANVHDGR
jgi:hypothetical protein